MTGNIENEGRFAEALRRIDQANADDPNRVDVSGKAEPRELVYSKWLSEWVMRLKPDASESLRLAARAQHLCRWQIPRNSYPMDRRGYLKWRQDLKRFHAGKTAEILEQAGYDAVAVAAVQALILKRNFPNEPESRILEDALCLVFLERQFGDLAAKTEPAKVINALKKSWAKMTPAAQQIALTLRYEPHEEELLKQALESGGSNEAGGADQEHE